MPQRPPTTAGHYTTRRIGELLGVDAFTVARWIDQGHLHAFRTLGGHRRVSPEELRRFLVAKSLPLPVELAATVQTVLVVDDDRRVLERIVRAFRAEAPQIDLMPTESGIEGLLLIAHEKPSAALIDVHLPNLDGFEVCRSVRRIPDLAGIKLILMSGSATVEMRERAIEAGADAFLEKPFEPQDILRLLDTSFKK